MNYDIINQCHEKAQAELNKITCYDTKPKLNTSYESYEYVNDQFIKVSQGDRGEVYRSVVAHSEDEFIESLIYNAVSRFAFSYELHHRRQFEDNRRQVNEIIIKCYSFVSSQYKYTLMINLKDNIHIYFDLLDYYVKVSKEYLAGNNIVANNTASNNHEFNNRTFNNLTVHNMSEGTKSRISFIAEKGYANKSGGMFDVAFSFELVRYNISKIVEEIPELKNIYYLHDEHYERLIELEQKEPYDKEKYQLGFWDYSVFEKAEKILKTNFTNGNTTEILMGNLEAGNAENIINDRSENDDMAVICAMYMLIISINAKRNVQEDTENLINLSKLVDMTVDNTFFRKALEDLFITDKYGIFRREPYSDYVEYVRNSLKLNGE